MNSKKPIIIAAVIAVVIVLILTILLIALSGKKDNSEGNLAVENKVSTEKDTDKNPSKDDEEDDDDEKETNTNTSNRKKSQDDDDDDDNATNTNTSNRKKSRDEEEEEMLKALEETERAVFNSKFSRYKGKQTSKNISMLLDTLKANANAESGNDDFLPYIIYINSNGEFYEETTEVETIEGDIGNLEESHLYYVVIAENDETELSHGIVISYTMNDDIKDDVEDLAKEIANK